MGYREEYIPERNCKRYFAQDSYGQDLFFIELVDAGYPEYFLSASLPTKILEQDDLKKLRQIIVNKKNSDVARLHFIKKLIDAIKSQPEARNYFFQKHVLDKFGKFSEALDRTCEAIIFNRKLEILVPYSPYQNSEIFLELQKSYNPNDDKCSVIQAERELFEENLTNDSLKFSYVEVFSNQAKYFFEEERIEERLLQYYFMTIDDEMVFLFLIA
ncbi:MAG TPA: hypothetical protein VJY62_17355 [Bacteroidia bacterium]|nr:hypothetical protein [Bacteroidia bacterium]